MTVSSTHLVILPSFNTGARLAGVVVEVVSRGWPVLVVVDGSTDGSETPVLAMAKTQPLLTVQVLPQNSGKGAAVLAGAHTALDRGFTHALVMDSDGQHPAANISDFMEISREFPTALVLGKPIFPANIPVERLYGRKLSNGLAWLELLGTGIKDTLFGFRVYPLQSLVETLDPQRGGRRYDFDTEAAVRMAWSGVMPLNVAAPVRYFSKQEGGISHFHYVRDNVRMVGMHARLLMELIFRRWPALLRHRSHWRANPAWVRFNRSPS